MARNILIMSLTRMGDLVQATPVLEGVRERHPGARITLLVSSDFEACVPLVPGVDEALVFDLRQFSG
ncbi:MAG: hypothetical protein GWM98_16320, partial [Nitrospinaceae bacterium]|nr:glycosyltransferase family 9 protein [Nitrospinaceae bacterium]NIU42962.1 glycosyltransferase family 9 protein [Nitrospinaceae bacterium]NIU97417.1 hypothetical protein [Nitrospinaceae bacterium]NIW04550.1 hypothetical protein [Nitrospinaceae bacterium]NIW57735.1 hypothetical protein [Nitrospinaceae bacterium]